MWQSIGSSLLAGIVFGNGVPHFIKGITKENYPCMLGNSPTPNLIAGWLSFILFSFVVQWVDTDRFRTASLIAGSVGLLAIGLFHSSIGAFGRKR